MHHIPVRESSCFSRAAKSTGAVPGASLLLLRCNLKSTYEGNLARFYVLELRDVARPRVSLESLNLTGGNWDRNKSIDNVHYQRRLIIGDATLICIDSCLRCRMALPCPSIFVKSAQIHTRTLIIVIDKINPAKLYVFRFRRLINLFSTLWHCHVYPIRYTPMWVQGALKSVLALT